MPTILRKDGFRFLFYSNEGNEPCHIHVKKGGGDAKIWLEPEIQEAYFYGFSPNEIKVIRETIIEHETLLKEKWNEYFNN